MTNTPSKKAASRGKAKIRPAAKKRSRGKRERSYEWLFPSVLHGGWFLSR